MLIFALGLLARVFAQNATLTHIHEYYDVPDDLKSQRHHFEIDASVCYYDPLWNQFYGLDGTTTFYIGTSNAPRFSIYAGQVVHLAGEVVPDGRFVPTSLTISPVAGAEPKRPLIAHGHLADYDALNARLISIDALVDWQEQFDPAHQRLSLIAEGQRLNTTLWLPAPGQAPLLEGAIVHAVGMYLPHRDLNGQVAYVELKVQGPENLQFLQWLGQDPRFQAPVLDAPTVAALGPGHPVHVVGKVDLFAPGRFVRIRDRTGVIELFTPQEKGLHQGAEIEAVGISRAGAVPSLDQAFWRLRGAAETGPRKSEPLELRLASEVLDLSGERAAAQQPVRLTGVVTWSSENGESFFLQDQSAGVLVKSDPARLPGYVAGLQVSVGGVTAIGNYAPEVHAREVEPGGTLSAPEPAAVTLEQALSGAEQNRWVEMKGYVRAVEARGKLVQLDLTTATGEFQALFPKGMGQDELVGSFVRIRGVCDTIANGMHHSAGIRLWVPAEEHIAVEEPPLRDPMAVPFTPLDSVGGFGHLTGANHWLHTVGTVTYVSPRHFVVIQSGHESLVALTRENPPLTPGDEVDAVGIPGWDGSRFVLRESVLHRTGREPQPEPTVLTAPLPVRSEFDSVLVQMKAELAEISSVGGEYYLTLRIGRDTVVGRLRHYADDATPESWRKGSTVGVVGVYHLLRDENRVAGRAEILLRNSSDLTVTVEPPWWTVERAQAAAGLLGVLVIVVAGWVMALRSRVSQQTREIRSHLESEASLESELQRSQRVHSLGMLAGGIAHDFNNLLTVISGNLALAMLDDRAMALVGDCLRDAEEGAKRAQELSQRLLTFARGGDPVLQDVAVIPIVAEAASLALAGSRTQLDFSPAAELSKVRADPNQLRRAIQNLMAFGRGSMSDQGRIAVVAADEEVTARSPHGLKPGHYVKVTVTDHGHGIPAAQLRGIFDPYAAAALGREQFGLATAYSILKKHGGFIAASSSPGKGARFELWLPVAVAAPQGAMPEPTGGQGAPKRILFMDDEEAIRRMGKRVLESLQCEVTTVADGQACISSFREAKQSGQPFDFVILDLSVPGGMGGAEAVTQLRELDPGVRAIVSSGYSNDKVIANFQSFGFCAFLPKPYDTRTLAMAIEQATRPST